MKKTENFIVKYLPITEHPEIARFIRMSRHTIYINTAALPDANVVQLIQ